MSKSLLPSIDAMSARKNQYFRARRSIVCIYTHADDVSCDSQIMSNDHETDVIINVISSGLWRLLTEGNFKPWFLGLNDALGNWSGTLSVMHYRNQMKWNELLNYKLPADIHLRITWKKTLPILAHFHWELWLQLQKTFAIFSLFRIKPENL